MHSSTFSLSCRLEEALFVFCSIFQSKCFPCYCLAFLRTMIFLWFLCLLSLKYQLQFYIYEASNHPSAVLLTCPLDMVLGSIFQGKWGRFSGICRRFCHVWYNRDNGDLERCFYQLRRLCTSEIPNFVGCPKLCKTYWGGHTLVLCHFGWFSIHMVIL